MLPTEETIKIIDAFEESMFIGYSSGLWDDVNLIPITSKGITATPILINFQGKNEFLIDASAFPGSSGSPVFLYKTGAYLHKSGAICKIRVGNGSCALLLIHRSGPTNQQKCA